MIRHSPLYVSVLFLLLLLLPILFLALSLRLASEVVFAQGNLHVAVFFDPFNQKYHFLLGTMYLQEGKIAPARYHLEKALKTFPTDQRALNNLALLHASQGELGKARVLALRAHLIDLNNEMIWNNYKRFREVDEEIRLDKKGKKGER